MTRLRRARLAGALVALGIYLGWDCSQTPRSANRCFSFGSSRPHSLIEFDGYRTRCADHGDASSVRRGKNRQLIINDNWYLAVDQPHVLSRFPMRSSCHPERSEGPLIKTLVTLDSSKRALQLRDPSSGDCRIRDDSRNGWVAHISSPVRRFSCEYSS